MRGRSSRELCARVSRLPGLARQAGGSFLQVPPSNGQRYENTHARWVRTVGNNGIWRSRRGLRVPEGPSRTVFLGTFLFQSARSLCPGGAAGCIGGRQGLGRISPGRHAMALASGHGNGRQHRARTGASSIGPAGPRHHPGRAGSAWRHPDGRTAAARRRTYSRCAAVLRRSWPLARLT